MALRWLLCDLDGTLADTMAALRHAYDDFCRGHNITPSADEFARLNGPPLDEVVRRLSQTHRLSAPLDELQAEYHRHLGEAYVHAPPGRGHQRLLAWAAAQGVQVAVVTGSARAVAEAWLRHHGLHSAIAFIIAGDDGHVPKPDRAAYVRALAKAGITAAEAVAIEDSRNGVTAATAAGIRTLWVRPQALPDMPIAPAAEIVADLGAAVTVLQRPAWIVARGAVEIEIADAVHPADSLGEVASAWRAALQQRPFLFDGAMLSLDAWSWTGTALRVAARPCAYRSWTAQRRGLPLGLRPLAVCGIIERDGLILCGQRTQQVASFPGAWEPLPCGSLEPEHSISAQVLKELSEETGCSGEVGSPWGLVEHDGVIDIVVPVTIASDAALRRSPEHHRLAWRSPSDFTGSDWIPAAAALAALANGSTGTCDHAQSRSAHSIQH